LLSFSLTGDFILTLDVGDIVVVSVVNLLLGVGITVALPESARKSSKYIQLLERNSGHGESHAPAHH
jgi:hypothetical protein